MKPELSITKRIRTTPFTSRVEACGVKGYAVYNHMLLPTKFRSLEEDYWHLCEHVQVWDVSCERQVEIIGPDAERLVQLMTPRDLSRAKEGMCFYVPLCDETGAMINDPIAIKHDKSRWWLSIADTDVMLWAKGLATGYGMDVRVFEPDVCPLAVQGPKAEELTARLFGEEVRDIGFFRYKRLAFEGHEMLVTRSGWSKQGGFEIYVEDAEVGRQIWDALFDMGKDLNVGPGCPNSIERIESGLLSFGADMGYDTTPFECGLEKYVSLGADIDSLGIIALRRHKPTKKLVGVVVEEPIVTVETALYVNGQSAGEICSQVWSPRYQAHLIFAMCRLEEIAGASMIDVITTTGQKQGRITSLPFDFEELGLKG